MATETEDMVAGCERCESAALTEKMIFLQDCIVNVLIFTH